MPYSIKPTKKTTAKINRTLYIEKSIIERLDRIAAKNNTSTNNLIISMIEYCLEEEPEQ